tara:strand:+ start:32 stop:1756 length:1725 start_codon:yes stop_codon:yes gene_type:complete
MAEIIKFYKTFIKIFSTNQKKQFFTLIAFSIIAMTLETISLASIFPILDLFFNGSSKIKDYLVFEKTFNSFNEEQIVFLLPAIFLLVFLIKAIFLTFFLHQKNNFVYNIRNIQTNNLLKSYVYNDYLFHLDNNSATLIRNINDANLLSVFARSLIDFTSEIILFTGILIFLVIIYPILTISISLFFFFIAIVFFKIFQSKISIYGEKSRYYRGRKLKNLKEIFGGIREIKIFGQENNFLKLFNQNNFFENDSTKRHTFISGLPKIWFEWLTILILSILLIFLIKTVEQSNSIIPLLGLYLFAAFKIVPAVIKIINLIQDMRFSLPSIRPYISNKSQIEGEIFDNKKNIDFEFKNIIEINNLKYEYPSAKKEIFNGLNISISKNQLVGIYGESGTGKTTLINLLLGLLRPDTGNILVDKKNIFNNVSGWQKKISYIPQSIFITDEKILNNVALGAPENKIDVNKVNDCLKFANLSKFIDELPKGLNTHCGELGDKISGGQKQRLAIARAIYHDSEVLIFDEFTNNLDQENENKIMEDILKLKDKTRIIVTHSSKVLSYCEKKFEIKNKIILDNSI